MKRSEKIFYDLTESNEIVKLENCEFYFSSSFNKERFENGYQDFIKEEENKIIAKYNVNLSIKLYMLIAYYLRIEKRGFFIKKYSTLTKDYSIILDRNKITFVEIEV